MHSGTVCERWRGWEQWENSPLHLVIGTRGEGRALQHLPHLLSAETEVVYGPHVRKLYHFNLGNKSMDSHPQMFLKLLSSNAIHKPTSPTTSDLLLGQGISHSNKLIGFTGTIFRNVGYRENIHSTSGHKGPNLFFPLHFGSKILPTYHHC